MVGINNYVSQPVAGLKDGLIRVPLGWSGEALSCSIAVDSAHVMRHSCWLAITNEAWAVAISGCQKGYKMGFKPHAVALPLWSLMIKERQCRPLSSMLADKWPADVQASTTPRTASAKELGPFQSARMRMRLAGRGQQGICCCSSPWPFVAQRVLDNVL